MAIFNLFKEDLIFLLNKRGIKTHVKAINKYLIHISV